MQFRKVGNEAFKQLKELSKIQKIEVAASIVACALAFYAIGIATDFFANPIFSMFFFISHETAHNVVTYVAAVIAIVFGIVVVVSLLKKGKSHERSYVDDEYSFRS